MKVQITFEVTQKLMDSLQREFKEEVGEVNVVNFIGQRAEAAFPEVQVTTTDVTEPTTEGGLA